MSRNYKFNDLLEEGLVFEQKIICTVQQLITQDKKGMIDDIVVRKL